MFIAILNFASLANATSSAYSKEVNLPKLEALKIEKLACSQRHKIGALSINTYQYLEAQTPQSFNYANVQCKPHGEFNGSPIYFTSSCDFVDKQWVCDEPVLHISVAINNRKVDVAPGPLAPEEAEDILKKISTYGGFRGRSIDSGIGNHCSIQSTSDPEELDLACSDGIRISFWCPQPEITHCPRILKMDLIIND